MKHAALARRRAHADRAPLRLDEPPRQCQAEARALVPLRRTTIELLKLDEQAPEVRGLNADAGVFDLEPKLLCAVGHGSNRDASTFGRELERVRHVVVCDLL